MKFYLRYGDDFILVHENQEKLKVFRELVIGFLEDKLKLKINPKHDKILIVKHGLKYLGVQIFSEHRKLNKRNKSRIKARLSQKNVSSYLGLVKKHGTVKDLRGIYWRLISKYFFIDE